MENQDLDLLNMVFHRFGNINKQFDIKKVGEVDG